MVAGAVEGTNGRIAGVFAASTILKNITRVYLSLLTSITPPRKNSYQEDGVMKVISENGEDIWIELSSGDRTVISSCDSWILREFPVWGITGSASRYVFVERGIKTEYSTVRERVYLHRVITRPAFNGLSVDHIDRDRLNNRRSNLRFCSPRQNMANVGPKKNKKFKGVFEDKGRKLKKPYSTYISYLDGKSVGLRKRKYLGRFSTAEEAAIAYNKAAKELWGEFAYQNDVRP